MAAAGATGEDIVRRGPGRPRKVSTVTKQEYIDDGSDPEKENDDGFAGLFDDATAKTINRVRISRRDPNEGVVGYLEDPTMGEAEIKERWGGSTYLIQGIDAKGMVRKATVIKIAGDPIFVSQAAEVQWRKTHHLPMTAAGVVAGAEKGMGFQEMLMFIQAQEQTRRQEEREHQTKMREIEIKAEDERRREGIAAAERARRDDEERERRRVRDEEERETRRRREQTEAEARQQQFMQQTITMVQQSSAQALSFMRATTAAQPAGGNNLMDAVKTVVAIKEAFAGEGEGGDESVMQTLIKHGGEWVSGLSNGIVGAIREVKGGGVAPVSSGAPGGVSRTTVSPASASPLALLPPNHPINEKVETLVAKLAAKGLDPLSAMATIVDNVLKDVDKIPQQGAPRTATGAVDQAPKPYVQSPEGIGGAAPPVAAAPTPVAAPKVIRRSFGK